MLKSACLHPGYVPISPLAFVRFYLSRSASHFCPDSRAPAGACVPSRGFLKIFKDFPVSFFEFSGLFYCSVVNLLFQAPFSSYIKNACPGRFPVPLLLNFFCASARYILPRFPHLVNNFFYFLFFFAVKIFHNFSTAEIILSSVSSFVNIFFIFTEISFANNRKSYINYGLSIVDCSYILAKKTYGARFFCKNSCCRNISCSLTTTHSKEFSID